MHFKKELIIRGIIFLIGILIIINSIIDLFSLFSSKIDIFLNLQDLNLSQLDKILFFQNLFFILFGYILLLISTSWTYFFKRISKSLISISVLFLTFSCFFYAININSENILNNIQPSLDSIIVTSLDSTLETYLYETNSNNNQKLDLILFKNLETKTLYTSNLSYSDSNLISNAFGFSNFSKENKLFLSKVIISEIFNEFEKNNLNMLETEFSLKYLNNSFSNLYSNFNLLDENLFNNNLDILNSFISINNNAYITILINDDSSTYSINSDNISINEIEKINLIWSNLGLKNNNHISNQTKINIIKIILNAISSNLDYLDSYLNNLGLPLVTIKSQIPNEISFISNYDLFNLNTSKRLIEINKLRDDCIYFNKNNSNIICDYSNITLYDNFIPYVLNQSNQTALMKDMKLIENISSINKIENTLNDISSKYKKYIFISLFFFILAFITYYLHFKLFNRELLFIHIPYYLIKITLLNFVFYFIFSTIIYFVITSNFFIDFLYLFLLDIFKEQSNIINNLLYNFPLFEVLFSILFDVILVSLFVLILLSLILLILYFILKKEVESENQY